MCVLYHLFPIIFSIITLIQVLPGPIIFPIISKGTIQVIFPMIFPIILVLYHLFIYYFLLFPGEAAQMTGAARHTSSPYALRNDLQVTRWACRASGSAG
jgi:hypothetical protein